MLQLKWTSSSSVVNEWTTFLSHFFDDRKLILIQQPKDLDLCVFYVHIYHIYRLTWQPLKCQRASRSRSASKPCLVSSRFAIVGAPRWMQLFLFFFLFTVFRGKSIIIAIRRMLVDIACYCLTSTRCRSMLLFDEHSLMQHVTV